MKKQPTIPLYPKRLIGLVVEKDPKLAPWIEAIGKFPLRRQDADFDLLCRSVVGQSISIQAAATIARRIRDELAIDGKLQPRSILTCKVEKLKSLGLSTTKAEALHCLAEIWKNEKLHSDHLKSVPDDELIDKLSSVRGVGPWTVKMFLIFGLRRVDVFPQEDLGVRLGIQKLEGWKDRPTPKMCIEKAEIWKPYRSVPTIFMWQILLLEHSKSLENSGWWSEL